MKDEEEGEGNVAGFLSTSGQQVSRIAKFQHPLCPSCQLMSIAWTDTTPSKCTESGMIGSSAHQITYQNKFLM